MKEELQQTFIIIITNLISKIQKTCHMLNCKWVLILGYRYFTLNWTVITDTLDMTSIYYLKNNELISLVYICSEIQLQLLPVIERTFTLKIICSQDVKIKNDVAIFIIAIWQDISIECQKFISSLFIAMNWIYWWIKLWRGRDINI